MSVLACDGDIIRGLGFVALYSAYAEEQIDNILECLHPIEAFDVKKRRWPISKKIKHAGGLVERIASSELSDLQSALAAGPALFEERNEVVHGRIYAGFDRTDTLQSGRANVPLRIVTAEELYELANEFSSYRSALIRPQIFKLPRAISGYLNRVA